ncbi:MAG TPA: hypothetical protein VGL06_08210, partial [Pseudonocardiaceae bacterium]
PMRVPDFDQLAADLIVADDHPEIVSVRLTAPPDNARYHNRLMTVDDFKQYFQELLTNSGHTAIAGVKDLAVRGTDGVTLSLSIVRTSPPGGDKSDREVVTKSEPGVKVIAGE